MTSEPTPSVLVIRGPVRRGDIAGLCDRVCAVLNGLTPGAVVCEVRGVVAPDAATLDALARLRLAAGRLGHDLMLRNPSRELLALLGFAGLSGVLPVYADLRVEPGRQPEDREEPGGVEEGVERGDLPA